jgi:hypothetical protein
MSNPAEDLHRKPYNDTEALYQAVLWALEEYGRCKHPKAVLRTSFTLTPDPKEFGGRPGWVLITKLEGFGDIPLAQGAQRVNIEDIVPAPEFTEQWEVRGQTIYLAGEELRKEVAAALDSFLQARQAEAVSAKQALDALRSGVDPEELWPEPEKAEVTLEAIAENPSLAGAVPAD